MKSLRITISEKEDGKRLDQALADLLPAVAGVPLSKAKVRKLIIAGAVYMNRGRIRIASKTVRKGMRLEIQFDEAKLFSPVDRAWEISAIDVVYEDEWIVGVNKPAGLATQPTLDEARGNLYALLKKYYEAQSREKPGTTVPYVGLHHRLDRDTSGVMLFTRKKEANAEVGKIFQDHLARKTYWAIVHTPRKLPPTWNVDNFLARDSGKAGKMRAVRAGGDRARTDFRLLAQVGDYALVEAKPLTGRMHQIRVHLSEGGSAILGDPAYGGKSESEGAVIPRVMLHAVALTFPHPIFRLETTFRAPVPADFEQCLNQHHLPLLTPDS